MAIFRILNIPGQESISEVHKSGTLGNWFLLVSYLNVPCL